MLSGNVQVLAHHGSAFEWLDVRAGSFVQIPGGAKHGFRNRSSEPVVQLITTSARLGEFFREVGRPVGPGAPPLPATPRDIDRFSRVAARFDHWLGSPEENAEVGIGMPEIETVEGQRTERR